MKEIYRVELTATILVDGTGIKSPEKTALTELQRCLKINKKVTFAFKVEKVLVAGGNK